MVLDFIIAGVQRGGTSALHSYLSQHPRIFLPKQKELHFFDNEKLDWDTPDYGILHAHFRGKSHGQIVGEATPIYVFWEPAIGRIHRYNPRIQLIVTLRDPVERAYSQWAMRVERFGETQSFSEAVRNPSGGPRRSYVERGLYAAQIERLAAAFPDRQLLFLRSEDLRNNHRDVLDAICRFLGVDRFAPYPQPAIVNLVAGASQPPMTEDDRAFLARIYRDDTLRTQALTGLDLSRWSPLSLS